MDPTRRPLRGLGRGSLQRERERGTAVRPDYDWDSDAEDISTSMGGLGLSSRQEPAVEQNGVNPQADNNQSLSSFFEYAPKTLPEIAPNHFAPKIGMWNNEIAQGGQGQPLPPATPRLDPWAGQAAKAPVVDESEEKRYVDQYKKAMEEQIANTKVEPKSAYCEEAPINNLNDNDDNLKVSRITYSDSGESESLFGTIPPMVKLGGRDEVWDQYDMDVFKHGRETEELAVHKHKYQIMDSLENNQITIIEGFTGCGKTTQIPQYILESYCKAKAHCNIVVTQPRRLAAISVATRVCDEKGWDLGSIVGYQVGLSRKTSPVTRLTYVTTGVLLQLLISRKNLEAYTHIIVDEVHERDLETDLLLLILKKLLVQTVDKQTKVILMSATLNPKKFADYFPKWPTMNENVRFGAVIVRIPTESFFPIREVYMEPSDSSTYEENGEPKVQEACYKLAIHYITQLDRQEDLDKRSDGHRGGVLIFLPGFLEIETMCTMLTDTMHTRARLARDKENSELFKWTILPLHSSITSEEQQKVFHRVSPGYRKIVVSTNIAESSITVTDMRYVIDFCLTKSLGYDPSTNYTCLRMEWASKDQCTQRKGRVGRVAPGTVYRLVTRAFYNSLGKETVPDMEKSSLENVVLKVKNLNMGSPKSILALAIDPPKLSLITRAVAHLKEVGALTINVAGRYTQYNGDLTPMGVIMSKLPLDVKFSRLIVLGYVFGVLEETIIIAAGMSGKSPFSYPFQNRLGSYMSKLTWSSETFSDCFALLCVYRTWRYKWQSKAIREHWEERHWARQYFVQLNMMKEIHSQVEDITRRLKVAGMSVDNSRFDNEDMSSDRGLLLKITIAGAFYPNYFLKTRPSQKEYEKTMTRELCGYNPMHTMYFSGFPPDQPGRLYADSIASLFSTGNLMPTAEFSGSKVLLQFDPRGDRIGRVSLGIYRGLKMKQIRQNVTFTMLRPDLAQELARDEVGRDATPHIPSPPQVDLPKVNEEKIQVTVTCVELPDLFWVVYQSKVAALAELSKVLDTEAKNLASLTLDAAVPGSLCVVEFKGHYYRGRVEYKQNHSNVLVYLIDKGSSVWREVHTILGFNQTLISKGLHQCEGQAIQCRIQGIKQLAKFSGMWNDEAKLAFAKFAANRSLHLKVYSIVESVIACDLSTSPLFEEEKCIRHLFIKNKLAVAAEESQPSKDNSNVRKRVADFGGLREEDMVYHNEKQIKKYLPSRPIYTSRPLEPEDQIEGTLRGPFSPLDIEFSSLCRSAHMKPALIERSSVNSIALDQEPYSSTGRLLVAGSVAVAQRTGTIMARDTTIMPAVPGLVGLLTMLFCPKLELRVNFHLGVYTGCLSGLGVDPVNKRPIYPDHDIEVVFDTVFDQKDLNDINEIRSMMNFTLREDSESNQENMRLIARTKLNELLERQRPPQDEHWQEAPHTWGLIDEDKLIKYPVEDEESGLAEVGDGFLETKVVAVFPPHNLVRMQLQPDEDFYHSPTDFEQLNFEF